MVKFIKFILFIFVVLSGIIVSPYLIAQPTADSTIVVFGDTRTNHDVHRLIVKNIMQYKPVAVFHTGDLVFNGKSNSAWSIFEQISAPILDSSRFYPSFGNHEMHSAKMTNDFKMPNNGKWYSVNIGKIHFVVIDNYSDFKKGSKQYKWLVSDLAAADKFMFRVVVMHLPVYTSGSHKNKLKKIRKYLVPIFEQYGVSVVFSGHVHCYEKAFSNNIYYITTGGGGAPLYLKAKEIPESQLYIKTYHFCTLNVSGNNLKIQTIDTSRKVIDEVNLKGK